VAPLSFAAGSGSTIDLASTLPTGVVAGGGFGISSTGAALPVGMTLSPAGILSVGTASTGVVAGIVFTYAEPST
jgi:hypothetical protein